MVEGSTPKNAVRQQDTSARLRESKRSILEGWANLVRKELPAAKHQDKPALYDQLPQFIDELVESLSNPKSKEAPCEKDGGICKEHGEQRAGLGSYSLKQVILEYNYLQRVIFDHLERGGLLDREERDCILAAINNGMSEAAAEFAHIHDSIREQFVAIITHDLRNPLSAAKTSAQMIYRVIDRPEKVEALVGRAVSSINRIEVMLQDLLDTFQIRAGKPLPVHIRPNDYKTVVKEAVEELTTVHGKRFVFSSPPNVSGHFCSDGIRRSIENLANNAIKYGDPQGLVTISVIERDQDQIEISVHNLGNPLITEEQAKLFTPFHRAPFAKASGQKGWGLGLTLVQAIAAAHSGTVSVKSNAGEGTTFTMTLPKNPQVKSGS